MENPVSMTGVKNAIWIMAAVLLALVIYNVYTAMRNPDAKKTGVTATTPQA